jgi:DNA-binding transcriptional regulator YhcF (GntR family)
MLTVEESVAKLTDKRKEIYDLIERAWLEENYVPSLREIARTLFIPFSTVVFHVNKLIEADLLYRAGDRGVLVLRGATTGVDLQEMCEPAETAYRKAGAQRKEDKEDERVSESVAG